ncbi:MAG: MFS transporter [Planctomycetaceae bacterium]|nr:MFS transporter [Planctomycetaceae bacterium]
MSKDRAFWGMTATQFLGAFNDNLFKQMVLLICVDYVAANRLTSDPYQTTAGALFALPFVLFSGFAGWLSDRISKRRVIVLSKVAEIVIMAAGMLAFLIGESGSSQLLTFLLIVLCVMGLQSAFFGPSKYGILPEMFRNRDLPAVNGAVQMTTFLAIIFGTAICGIGKEWLEDSGTGLWVISLWCVGIAVIGTLTSLLVRPLPAARPDLPFTPSCLAIEKHTWRMLIQDRPLMTALLLSSLFWFAGGTLTPAVNAFGKNQLMLGDSSTSALLACIGFGIAIGCLLGGKLSGGRVNFGVARIGAWGMVVMASGLAAVPWLTSPGGGMAVRAAALLFVLLGVSAGLFAVPLQVFMQTRPPAGQKGRMIGAMNLINWIGILLANGFYWLCTRAFTVSQISWTFAVIGGMMLPVALLYRPADEELT